MDILKQVRQAIISFKSYLHSLIIWCAISVMENKEFQLSKELRPSECVNGPYGTVRQNDRVNEHEGGNERADYCKNRAIYTAIEVACRWAGAVIRKAYQAFGL